LNLTDFWIPTGMINGYSDKKIQQKLSTSSVKSTNHHHKDDEPSISIQLFVIPAKTIGCLQSKHL